MAALLLAVPFRTDGLSQGDVIWQQLTNRLYGGTILSFAVNASGHLFAGTTGRGVFRYADNGDTWTPINSGLSNTNILSFVLNSSGYLFAGTDGSGVFRRVGSTTL